MTQDVYFGYYIKDNGSKILLGISKHKSTIQTYLENHRGLWKDQYAIDQIEIDDSDLIVKYEDYIITEYESYFIPNIDQMLIEYHAKDINIELGDMIKDLTQLATITANIKKISEKEETILLDAIRLIDKFRKSPKIMKKLNKEYNLSHSILYADIEEYLRCVKTFKEMRDYENYYKYAVTK